MSTPPKTEIYSCSSNSMNTIFEEAALRTRGKYLVGLQPEKFLDEFLPWNESTSGHYKEKCPERWRHDKLQDINPKPCHTESIMYKPFVDALDSWVTTSEGKSGKGFDEGLRFLHTGRPDTSCKELNPDVSTYWQDDFGDCTNFACLQTYEEIKPDVSYDPFQHMSDEGPHNQQADEGKTNKEEDQEDDEDRDDKRPERETVPGNLTRGQIAAYAGLALSAAFRKHLFSVLILGRYARFIRWDRCGAIATYRFDYAKEPTLIFNFYLRYGQLDSLQRGFDPGAKLCKLPGPVKDAFSKYHESQWHGATKFKRREASRTYKGFFRIEVKDDKRNSEIFFVPPPRFSHASLFPFCRSTRRSLACLYRPGVETQMCFLKDSWQVNTPRIAREAVIYQRLKDANVKNVASMRIGGDIEGFETETQEWIRELFTGPRFLDKMYCHRIILNTVADDLSTFIWGKVLLSCIADAIEAAQQAYSAGILHRDVSAGNIMLTRDKQTKQWRGILIDWEMNLLLDNEGEAPRSGRTGTWAFISANVLQNPSPHQHTLADDIESFFWVLVYQAMRYLSHPMGPHELDMRMGDIFYKNVKQKNGHVTGGWAKKSALLHCSQDMSCDFFGDFDISGFNNLLDKLGGILHDRYKRQGEPCFRLDDPKDPLFANILRKAAMEMEPLCITPTALKSPTNDSKPPTDCDMWEVASFRDTKPDYFVMDLSADPTASEAVQECQQSELQSSHLHGMDGSYVSHRSKRKYVDKSTPDVELEQALSKRRCI